MAEFNEVMRQKDRIHEYYDKGKNGGCCKCPLSAKNNDTNYSCINFLEKHPEEAEKIIMDWAKEYPIVTNADKFEEVFGFKPSYIGCPLYTTDECKHWCERCLYRNFWRQEWKDPKENADD